MRLDYEIKKPEIRAKRKGIEDIGAFRKIILKEQNCSSGKRHA
jgi:hypothetical protein